MGRKLLSPAERLLTRRSFAASLTAAALRPSAASPAKLFPVRYARESPFEPLRRYIESGTDAFAREKDAAQLEQRLRRIFAGEEPAPRLLTRWIERRSRIRSARFFVLPGSRIRFEIAMAD